MAKKKAPTSEVITLRNVRLSFPRLFTPKSFQPGQDARYEATFLLDPANKEHIPQINAIRGWMKKLATEGFGANVPKGLKTCLNRGDDKEYDGYAGMLSMASHNKIRPLVGNRKGQLVNEGENQAPYAGCYVNAKVTIWLQDNEYGKRFNVNLLSVQFNRDGDAFGIAQMAPEEAFEALEDGEEGVAEDDDIPF